jgi:hypothetical protein
MSLAWCRFCRAVQMFAVFQPANSPFAFECCQKCGDGSLVADESEEIA